MSEWIKVGDRLPEEGKCLGYDGQVEAMWYWPRTGFNNGESHTDPTHWMPLPEPPKD